MATNTELMEQIRKAKTAPAAAALMHKLDRAYRVRHAAEIKRVIAGLAK